LLVVIWNYNYDARTYEGQTKIFYGFLQLLQVKVRKVTENSPLTFVSRLMR